MDYRYSSRLVAFAMNSFLSSLPFLQASSTILLLLSLLQFNQLVSSFSSMRTFELARNSLSLKSYTNYHIIQRQYSRTILASTSTSSFSDQEKQPIPSWNGLIAVYKPVNFTSNDVVMKVRSSLRQRLREVTGKKIDIKVGHGGTLDPLAEGVMVLGIGSGTKELNNYLTGSKVYQTVAQLGKATNTLDGEGETTEEKDCSHVTEELVLQALPVFRGEIEQIPPMFSALKKGGQRLYDLARKGVEVVREPRKVTVYRLDYLSHAIEKPPHSLCLEVECSGGFYVRTLIDDLARKLGTVGFMKRLIRTRQGVFELKDCLEVKDWTVERIEEKLTEMNKRLNFNPIKSSLQEEKKKFKSSGGKNYKKGYGNSNRSRSSSNSRQSRENRGSERSSP